MDKRKGLLNIAVSILCKTVLLLASLFVRRSLIQYLGNEINGLHSLYLSIIGFLSVAELGIGTAISFSMYKPIIDGDKNKVAALYILFKKVYLAVGGIIVTAGLILTPFLEYFVNDYEVINIDIYIPFVILLLSVFISYLYSAKTSLINAYKNNYITTIITSAGEILRYILQAVALIVFRSFVAYLGCCVTVAVFEWLLTETVVRKKHSDILCIEAKLDSETQAEVTKNIKAMFMHKVGGVLVSTADSMIISAFIGVMVLGKYSNYIVIMEAMCAVLSLFFSPLTSVIGHLCAEGNKSESYRYFNFFYWFNYVIGVLFFLGYYAVIDNVVTICFGKNLELTKTISFIITMNQFIQFMRKATLLFKDAEGLFYQDRWKPICEGVLNVLLSVLFVRVFPEDNKVVGVIAATILTTLLICYVVEPFVLFKYAFKISPRKFYFTNYGLILVFAASLFILNSVMTVKENEIVELLLNGCISVGIAAVVCLLLCVLNKDFRDGFVKPLITNIKKFVPVSGIR